MNNYNSFKSKKKNIIKFKRAFDIIFSFLLIIILSPLMIYIAIKIKKDSAGPIIFKQDRVTEFGRTFKIFKFRTMVVGSHKQGELTLGNDNRITEFGKKIRDYRLDELPQLFNILVGDMSFVGPRPEVPKYVKKYDKNMMKTLWVKAGVTSEASILYKDEAVLIDKYANKGKSTDEIYLDHILPEKMKNNINYINKLSIFEDIKILIKTIVGVFKM